MSPLEFARQHPDVIADAVEYEVDGIPTVDFVGHGGRRFGVQLPGGWATYDNPAALFEPALRALRTGYRARTAADKRDSAARLWAARQARASTFVLDEMGGPGRGLSVV